MASSIDFVACTQGDVELVATIIDAKNLAIAAGLLDHFGGLLGLEAAGVDALAAATGMDHLRAARLRAALRLARRCAAARPDVGEGITTAHDVYRICSPLLIDEPRELFMALALDCRNRIRARLLIATGTLTSVSLPVRDAFRPLLMENAAGVIFVHNHPSGDPEPSDEDRLLTAQLVQAGSLLGVRVLDHVVVARLGFVSILADERKKASFTK